MNTIKKSIEITAPKDKVWAVLLEDSYNRDWFSAFGEGLSADTDWVEGHKVAFMDKARNGIFGKVVTKLPYEKLSIMYEGLVVNGEEDYDSENAKAVNGSEETYELSEENGNTWLSVSSDTDEKNYEWMNAAWEKALQRISELSHAI